MISWGKGPGGKRQQVINLTPMPHHLLFHLSSFHVFIQCFILWRFLKKKKHHCSLILYCKHMENAQFHSNSTFVSQPLINDFCLHQQGLPVSKYFHLLKIDLTKCMISPQWSNAFEFSQPALVPEKPRESISGEWQAYSGSGRKGWKGQFVKVTD